MKKRRDQKLVEMKDAILDEEFLFGETQLTEAEEHNLSFKRKIYELSKEHLQDVDDNPGYRLPEAYDQEGGVNQEKRFAAFMQRYRDPTAARDKMNLFAEQEAWEEHQIALSFWTCSERFYQR